VEKHYNNYSLASKMIKEQMDKKFGSAWHCVIGEGFDGTVSIFFKTPFLFKMLNIKSAQHKIREK
jgi:hypothetical protein